MLGLSRGGTGTTFIGKTCAVKRQPPLAMMGDVTMRKSSTVGLVAIAFALVAGANTANALGLKECSDKYSAAKTAGTAGTKTFADFQKSDCGPDAKPVAAPSAAAATPAAATPEKKPRKTKAEKAADKAAASTQPLSTTAVFPTALNAAYKDRKPAKQRMATCLDQYKANKTTNANGGLKWIQKGGGYYSQCNRKLKEAKA
jgi:hypothetical protein